jgi:HEAT repeat protein
MNCKLRYLVVVSLMCFLAQAGVAHTSPTAQTPTTTQSPREQAWTALKPGLVNSNIEKRTRAVADLGLLPDDPQALDAGLTALKDPKPEVRAAAAQALGEMEAKGAIPQLKEALKDTDPSVILAAGHALISLKDDDGYDVFYAVLTGQEKPNSGLMGEGRKYLDDPRKLASLGFETALGFVPFGSISLSAYKFLSKDDSGALAAAALTLAKDPDPQSGKALADAALTQKKWLVRAAAFNAIAKRDDPSLIHTAVEGLQDAQDEVQYAAAAAVIHLSDVESARKEKPKRVTRPKHSAPPKQQ